MSKNIATLLHDPDRWTDPASDAGPVPIRLLVAGGCHVGGFPAGEASGFVALAAERLRRTWPGSCFEARTLLHVSLASVKTILTACRQFRPDVLVLQLGHYESSLPLAKRLARLLRVRPVGTGREVSSWTPNYEPNPELCFTETRQRRLKSGLKLAIDSLLRLFGRPAFEVARLEQPAAAIMAQAKAAGVAHVVVLSPFPALDATIARYRREMRDLLLVEAARQGCHFLDCAAIAHGAPHEYFADDRHLAREGHRRVSLLLAEKIGRVLALNEVRHRPAVSIPAPVAAPALAAAAGASQPGFGDDLRRRG